MKPGTALVRTLLIAAACTLLPAPPAVVAQTLALADTAAVEHVVVESIRYMQRQYGSSSLAFVLDRGVRVRAEDGRLRPLPAASHLRIGQALRMRVRDTDVCGVLRLNTIHTASVVEISAAEIVVEATASLRVGGSFGGFGQRLTFRHDGADWVLAPITTPPFHAHGPCTIAPVQPGQPHL